jgi:cytochrome c peroxidase
MKTLIGTAVIACIAFALASAVWSESVTLTGDAMPLEGLKQAYQRPPAIPYPADNSYTQERGALGKTLFFDPRLSQSNTISCATCHDPSLSWGDGRPVGMGIGRKPLARRTPTIFNLAWTELLFWDGRADGLEAQAIEPISSALEMNQSLDDTILKLREVEGYRRLFEVAYPGEGITARTLGKALATFERTVVSGPTPFDAWITGKHDAISASAARGFMIFNTRGNCLACHSGWALSDGGFHDIGLPSADRGRGALLPLQAMQYAFKTPTLRNVARRGPYMHDGSVATLLDVVERYDQGGEVRPSRSKEVRPLGLSAQDKADLVAFMETLTSAEPVMQAPDLPR